MKPYLESPRGCRLAAPEPSLRMLADRGGCRSERLAGDDGEGSPAGPGVGLYLHVPFCARKCDYCSFASAPPAPGDVDRYITSVREELACRAPSSFAPATVFAGGGNPTLLGAAGWRRLGAGLLTAIDPARVTETTVESNPETLRPEIAAALAVLPGLRLSIGVQRFRDRELAILGRPAAAAALEPALSAAFAVTRRVGIDLILGVPGAPSLVNDLAQLLDRFPIEHVSAYFLTVETGTPLARRVEAGELADPAEEGADEYREVADELLRRGFEQIEISNFARPGAACRHNLDVWQGGDYLGIGPSAVSTWRGRRQTNPSTLDAWLDDPGRPAQVEKLTPSERFNERVMLGLRLVSIGLDLECLASVAVELGLSPAGPSGAGCGIIDALLGRAAAGMAAGWLTRDGGRLRLTPAGRLFANRAIAPLLL